MTQEEKEKIYNILYDKKCIAAHYKEEDPFVGIYFSDLIDLLEDLLMAFWLENRGEQQPTDNKERLDLLNFIRKETGCGLAEANNALLKLIKVLKQRPLLIMDKPHKLKIEWEEQQ